MNNADSMEQSTSSRLVENSEDVKSKLMQESPRLYVENYWATMTEADLMLLKEKIADDGFFSYYSRKIHNFRRKNEILQRNKRFLAMKALVDKGEFFTIAEMKSRDPVLYDELVGQLLSETDVNSLACEEYNTYQTASQMLLGQIDHLSTSARYFELLEKEGEALLAVSGRSANKDNNEEEEEEEEEEEDEDEEMDDDSELPTMDKRQHYSNEEKKLMTREFISQMEERFLRGENDSLVNYKTVSCSNFAICDQDKEDDYFDAEEPKIQDVANKTPEEGEISEGQLQQASQESDPDDYLTMDLSKF